jgi:hypothetical protein
LIQPIRPGPHGKERRRTRRRIKCMVYNSVDVARDLFSFQLLVQALIIMEVSAKDKIYMAIQ